MKCISDKINCIWMIKLFHWNKFDFKNNWLELKIGSFFFRKCERFYWRFILKHIWKSLKKCYEIHCWRGKEDKMLDFIIYNIEGIK